jgi:Domain of unknown function (DUF4382)
MESFLKRVESLAAGLFILGLMGCGQEARIGVSIVEMRDRSRDVERAVITLSTIELLREDDPAPLALGDRRFVDLVEPAGVGNWMPEFPRPPSSSPGSALVMMGEIPAGSYRAIRFAISGGFIDVVQVTGSTKRYMTQGYEALPSNTQSVGELVLSEQAVSGFTVELQGGVSPRTERFDITLDLDVARSFTPDTDGRWVLHPQMTETASSLHRAGLSQPQSQPVPARRNPPPLPQQDESLTASER